MNSSRAFFILIRLSSASSFFLWPKYLKHNLKSIRKIVHVCHTLINYGRTKQMESMQFQVNLIAVPFMNYFKYHLPHWMLVYAHQEFLKPHISCHWWLLALPDVTFNKNKTWEGSIDITISRRGTRVTILPAPRSSWIQHLQIPTVL